MAAVRSSAALSRIVASEFDITLGTAASWSGARVPLIYCHGSGDTATSAYGKPSQGPLIVALAQYFTVCVADLGFETWGNDTALSRIESVRQHLAANWNASGPVVLVTGSMGTLGGLAYTRANPGNVKAVASSIPALDINDIVVNNRGGAAAAVNTAYGGTYSDTTNGPTHSPIKFAASLPSTLPIALWTASDDPLCVPATATAFVAARPTTTRTNVGALGHSEASVAAATAGVVSFVSQFA